MTQRHVDMSVEIARVRSFRDLTPRVWAYEHARALGVAPSTLSKFETDQDAKLPNEKTFADYLDAVVRVKREKGATEAQIAPWAGVAA